MDYRVALYLSLYLLFFTVSLGVAIYIGQRNHLSGALVYSFVAFNQAAWTLFLILELLSSDLGAKIFWDDLQWINASILPVLLLWFALEFFSSPLRNSKLFWGLVVAFPVFFLGMVLTNSGHGLVRGISWLRASGPFQELLYSYTPLVISYSIFTLAILLVVFFLLALKSVNSPRPYRYQVDALIAGLICTILGILLTLVDLRLLLIRDAMPVAFAMQNVFVALGMSRYGLFGIMPVAQNVILEKMHDMVVVLDAKDRLVYLNPAALHSLDKSLADVIGQPIEEIFQHWSELVAVYKNDSEEHSEILSLVAEDGEQRYLELYISLIYDRIKRVKGRVVLVHDVTGLKRAEEELRQHREYLSKLVTDRTAELTAAMDVLRHTAESLERRVAERTADLEMKNRELETFAYSVSHDLKAPLRGIDGYSRLLMEGYNERLDDEGQLFLHNIRRATRQMHQLIEDLLMYSRLQRRPLSVGMINLSEVVWGIVSEHQGVDQNRKVEVVVDMECGQVKAEVDGLAQALRNLIDNAFKFTRDVPDPKIEIGSYTEMNNCVIWVKDNGVGFDMQYRDRIYEIFQRLHHAEEYPGTGVGLALVRMVAQRMGGSSWAEGVPGAGATFYLSLPLDDEQTVLDSVLL